MSTKPKVPKFDVPLIGSDGRISKDWFAAFSVGAHSGEYATTATAGAGTLPATPVGFITIYVNGTERKVAFYDV